MEDIIIYSERLIIRRLHEYDWPEFRELHLDADVHRFIRAVEPEADVIAKFNAWRKPWKFTNCAWLTLVIETFKGEFVGVIGFCCQDPVCKRMEVGYMLKPEQQGKGYASESLQTVIDWACLSFGVHKFVGYCACENMASLKVMEKSGFSHEGVLQEHYRIGDDWVDGYALGLLAKERWRRFLY